MQEVSGSPLARGCHPFHSLLGVKDSLVPGQNSDWVLTASGPSTEEAEGQQRGLGARAAAV